MNLTQTPILISPQERIAQMIIAKYEKVEWKDVKKPQDLAKTEHGDEKYGSTGKH